MRRIIDIPEEVIEAFKNGDINNGYYDCNSLIGKAIRNSTPLNVVEAMDITFKDDNAVNRLSVRDILYANAYELEYPDSSSEYVVNRDEVIKYLMELPSVYPKSDKPEVHWIKTENQLPKVGQWVLGHTENCQKPYEVMCYLGEKTNKGCNSEKGEYTYTYHDWTTGHGDIFHGPDFWQPLPKHFDYFVEGYKHKDCPLKEVNDKSVLEDIEAEIDNIADFADFTYITDEVSAYGRRLKNIREAKREFLEIIDKHINREERKGENI